MRKSTLALLSLTLTVALGTVLSASRAHADCVDPEDDNPIIPTVSLTGGSALSAPVPHQTMDKTIVASGGSLFIQELSDHSTSRTAATGSTINGTPIPVELDDGDIYVFVVNQDGRLRKYSDAGALEWSVDLRRVSGDSLNATAAVHLRRFASSSFQAKYTSDLVYVATRYNSSTRNRVYAVNADTGSIVWTFNSSGKLDVDVAHAAPFLDYDNDRLIVGTDRTASTSQDSLWSIDVITGTKAWSQNVGQLYAAPFVRDNRIYVATLFGDIKALSRTDGSSVWTASTGTPIMSDFFPEFREPYDGLIAYTDFAGEVGLVRDDKTSGTVVWSSSGLENPATLVSTTATSRIAIDSDNGKLYVGAADGELYQLSLLDGSVEATREVDSGSAVGDPGLVFEGGEVNLVVGSDSGELAKFCGPWTSEVEVSSPVTAAANGGENMSFGPPSPGLCSSAFDCSADEFATPCATWACVNNVCITQPVNEDETCDGDGNNNTPIDICKSGTCVGQSDCQANLDSCRCREADGSATNRRLLIAEPDCPNPPFSGLPPQWCGHEISVGTSNNECLAHRSPAATVVWIHLLDQQKRPFVIDPNVGSSNVVMRFEPGGGSQPRFLDPNDPDVNEPLTNVFGGLVDEVSLRAGTVLASSRPGTYYAYVGVNPDDGDAGTTPWQIQTIVTMEDNEGQQCIPEAAPLVLTSRIRMGSAADDCDYDSDTNNAGFVKIRVLNNFGAPLPNHRVRYGYSDDLRFALKFEEAITDTPSGTNLKATDNQGEVFFIDYGNYMNGGPVQDVGGSFTPMHIFVDCESGLTAFPLTSSDMTVVCS